MAKTSKNPTSQDQSSDSKDDMRPTASRAPWPGSVPRSVPYTPLPTIAPKPAIVDPCQPNNSIRSLSPPKGRTLVQATEKKPSNDATLLPLFISTGAFIAWLVLMVTVAAEGGSASQIIAITILPLLAHVVSLYLTVRRTAGDAVRA